MNTYYSNTTNTHRKLGGKRYELSNHLGNVLQVISDRKLPFGSGTTTDYYEAEVISYSDYYPFGMLMPNRHGAKTPADNHRYGFQGQESDDETYGSKGSSYNFGARMYDSRIARFNSVDPLANQFAEQSPYIYAVNNPLVFVDIDGKYAITIHYLITEQQLKKYGLTNAKQISLLAHYTAVYADHPPGNIVILNNILFPFNMMSYRKGIDYSGTDKSQDLSSSETTKWHAMKSDSEEKNNTITDAEAQKRGMEFGWNKIFESATEGKLDELEQNSKGIEAFGQGVHALQDSEAHKGVGMARHDHLGDLESDPKAHILTGSAIVVHQLMNDVTTNIDNARILVDGMNETQKKKVMDKIDKLGFQMNLTTKEDGSTYSSTDYTITKKD